MVRGEAVGVRHVLILAVLIGIGTSQVVLAVSTWNLGDWDVYRAAADRILAGLPLYSGADALHAYRYAPWLAYAAIPFNGAAWSALMLAASAIALVPLALRWRHPAALYLLMLFGPVLFYLSSSGNVQGLMLAVLVWTLPTRWAWAGIGLAASLKVVPILFALTLLAERRWWQAAGAVAFAAVLWLPVLWMGAESSTFDAGAARLLPLPVWALTSAIAVGVAGWLTYRQSKWTTLAAGVAAIASLPRFFMYDVTLLVPASDYAGRRVDQGANGRDRNRQRRAPASEPGMLAAQDE